MPELPEVETTRRGIEPYVAGQKIARIAVREPRLRYGVGRDFVRAATGTAVTSVERRGKYLLLSTSNGTIIVHLGMSGSLRVVSPDEKPRKHDHVDIELESGRIIRYHDPRRFGAILWTPDDPNQHPLLRNLGPEPLSPAFSAEYLHDHAKGRQVAVKLFIMDSKVVVGVGNIYANEALFMSGIHPGRAAGRIGLGRYEVLVAAIQRVLTSAIIQGGTTLRDFVRSDGQPGYFRQQLMVYERGGEPCPSCGAPIRTSRLGQRSTYYCSRCQR